MATFPQNLINRMTIMKIIQMDDQGEKKNMTAFYNFSVKKLLKRMKMIKVTGDGIFSTKIYKQDGNAK